MKAFLVFLFALSLRAQTLVPTLSPSSFVAGKSTAVTLTWTNGTTNAAALQWSSSLPAGASIAWTISSGATGNGKTLSCNSTGLTCALYGLNTTTLSNGIVATGALTVPNKGAQTFTVTGAFASDASGIAITASGGAAGLTATSPYDLNGDGLVNVTDLGLAAQQVTGATTCGSADFNGDGKCNVIDLILLVLDSMSSNP